jgi:hypothetical protein
MYVADPNMRWPAARGPAHDTTRAAAAAGAPCAETVELTGP